MSPAIAIDLDYASGVIADYVPQVFEEAPQHYEPRHCDQRRRQAGKRCVLIDDLDEDHCGHSQPSDACGNCYQPQQGCQQDAPSHAACQPHQTSIDVHGPPAS